MNFRKPPDMTVITAFLGKTCHDSGKEEKRPRWWPYSERSQRGWYSDTPLKTDARGDALKFPPTTIDNISHSHEMCLIQAADLFAGLASFSHENCSTYSIWRQNQSGCRSDQLQFRLVRAKISGCALNLIPALA